MEKLTESEEIVMKAIWDCHKGPVLSDVAGRVKDFYGKDWRPQTVSTFLQKLVQKGYLKMQRNGKIYTYKVLVPEAEYRRKRYLRHINFWNHNDIVGFVTEMIQNGDLSLADMRSIEEERI